MRRIEILNATIDAISEANLLEFLRHWIASGCRGYICTLNVAMLMMMRSNRRLKRFIDGSTITVADGQPLVWASRLQGTPLPGRIAGVDLVDDLCRIAAEEGFRVYFLGAKLDVVQAVAKRMQSKYSALVVCGVADGYLQANEAAARALAIRNSGTQMLFVGMGIPRQEDFLAEQWERLGVNLAIPVGGSFEVIAGRKRRAPVWMQRTGLEWFYRLCQEPRRLWKRYLITNAQFLVFLVVALIRRSISANRFSESDSNPHKVMSQNSDLPPEIISR